MTRDRDEKEVEQLSLHELYIWFLILGALYMCPHTGAVTRDRDEKEVEQLFLYVSSYYKEVEKLCLCVSSCEKEEVELV